MKISQLIDQLYWFSKFGQPKRKISSEALFSNPSLVEDPVFFLSTGRCGTEWFTYVLKKAKNVSVFHNPVPNLSVQNKFVFQQVQPGNEQANDIAWQILFAAREQHFRHSYKSKKRYIETNNHITFFAHTLAQIFPTAKFIHLYRHPGEFVTSGLNRGWFDHNTSATEKMIVPIQSSDRAEYSQIEKIAWVWNETNSFIESFKEKYPDRAYSYDFSKRNPDELTELFKFLSIPIAKSYLKKSLNVKRNRQKVHAFPPYDQWEKKDQEAVKAICGDLSKKYGFEI